MSIIIFKERSYKSLVTATPDWACHVLVTINTSVNVSYHIASMDKDGKADNQNKMNLYMSLYHDMTKCNYFPDFRSDILGVVEVGNMDTKEEGDWGWAYLAGKQQVNNMANDEWTSVVFCTSFFDFETKLLSYFLVGSVQLQVRNVELLICNSLWWIPSRVCWVVPL